MSLSRMMQTLAVALGLLGILGGPPLVFGQQPAPLQRAMEDLDNAKNQQAVLLSPKSYERSLSHWRSTPTRWGPGAGDSVSARILACAFHK